MFEETGRGASRDPPAERWSNTQRCFLIEPEWNGNDK
jgi:hypothetical protein